MQVLGWCYPCELYIGEHKLPHSHGHVCPFKAYVYFCVWCSVCYLWLWGVRSIRSLLHLTLRKYIQIHQFRHHRRRRHTFLKFKCKYPTQIRHVYHATSYFRNIFYQKKKITQKQNSRLQLAFLKKKKKKFKLTLKKN